MSKNVQAIGGYIIAKGTRAFVGQENLKKTGFKRLDTGSQQNKRDWFQKQIKVISVGKDATKVKVGDQIIFGTATVKKLDYYPGLIGEKIDENTAYFLCEEKDIAAIIN